MLNSVARSGRSSLVIASRESALAMWQARHVKDLLGSLYPALDISILGMTTEGDRRLGVSLAAIGGKGLFIKELEDALVAGRADIAVHSMKDVPMELPEGFALAAIMARADPRDAWVSNRYPSLSSLPTGARIGTSSLRRECQLRARLPGILIEPLRGNVNTRLRKLDEGAYDGIVLAAAGLKRLALDARITALLSAEESLPAVGQGALGIECRSDRVDLLQLLAPLADRDTTACVTAERAFSRRLAGSCNVPLAGHAELAGGILRLRGLVGSPDGTRVIQDEVAGDAGQAVALGNALADTLKSRGAAELLAAVSRP